MTGILNIFGLLALVSSIQASYNGPFVLWGRDEFSHANSNPLSRLDEKLLRDIYSDSSAIILFIRNASNHLKEDNFPIFKDLLSKTNYVYLTQQHLGSDPMEFNLNAEVIHLSGPTSQQDVELSALYHDAVITYGEGKVLGILATKTSDHEMRKRAIPDDAPQESSTTPTPTTTTTTTTAKTTAKTTTTTTTTTSAPTPSSEPDQTNPNDFIFYPPISAYKILLYTSSAPRLFDGNTTTVLDRNVATTITTDQKNKNENGEQRTLKVRYNFKDKDKLVIEYVFNISGGSWQLVAANIDWPKITENNTLYLTDDRPAAPLEFSYMCSRPLIFRNNTISLELGNIQVQLDVSAKRFNDSYDCIGFTSAPIWSGVFISFIICLAVALGINCIMEIKPPNRFENSRGKQLTFTIQE